MHALESMILIAIIALMTAIGFQVGKVAGAVAVEESVQEKYCRPQCDLDEAATASYDFQTKKISCICTKVK